MIVSALVAAFGLPGAAGADETDRFEPATEVNLLGLGGASLATGWVPAQGPIQVSFELHVGDTVRAEMLGDARYDWDAQTLSFAGDEGGGLFAVDIGVLLDARVRFDLLGMQYESELTPFAFPVPVLVDDEAPLDFDPVALTFAAPEPAKPDDSGGSGGGEGSSGALDASDGMDTGLNAESTVGEGSGDTTGDDAGAASDAGCSCRSQQSPISLGFLLGFLVLFLAGLRRRDRVGAVTSRSA